jgi:hypothetical protein
MALLPLTRDSRVLSVGEGSVDGVLSPVAGTQTSLPLLAEEGLLSHPCVRAQPFVGLGVRERPSWREGPLEQGRTTLPVVLRPMAVLPRGAVTRTSLPAYHRLDGLRHPKQPLYAAHRCGRRQRGRRQSVPDRDVVAQSARLSANAVLAGSTDSSLGHGYARHASTVHLARLSQPGRTRWRPFQTQAVCQCCRRCRHVNSEPPSRTAASTQAWRHIVCL